MKNCYDLNLNFLPINMSFVEGLTPEKVLRIGSPDITPECHQWIEKTGLTLSHALIFVRGPYTGNNSIHIDGLPGISRSLGINWYFGSKDIEMRWYKLINNVISKPSRKDFEQAGKEVNNRKNLFYTSYDPEEVELIETSRSSGPVLFNTTVPHTIVNLSDKTRGSISLAFKDNIPWQGVVKKLEPWIIKEEPTV